MSISARPSMFGVHVPQGIAVPPGPGPHVYWRIHITQAPAAGDYVAIAEAEFLDAGGTKLSTGGTASSSGNFGGFPPGNAFDGDAGTFWHTDNPPSAGSPEWLMYQLASPAEVAAVRIVHRNGARTQAPGNFSVQWSDDSSAWTTAATFSLDWTSIAQGRCFSFPLTTPAAGRYLNWRMKINSSAGGTPGGVEFEMRETAGGADIAEPVNGYAIWSDHFTGGFEGFYVFDNDLGTMWAAGSVAPGNYIGQAFKRAVNIVEIKWTARNDGFYNQSPLSITMQATNNGVTWTDIATAAFAAWTSAGQSQVVAVV